jgi:hypothetical protein
MHPGVNKLGKARLLLLLVSRALLSGKLQNENKNQKIYFGAFPVPSSQKIHKN